MGKGKKANIFVQLRNPADKAKIFSKVGELKDVVNRYNDPYSVEDHLPPKTKEDRRKLRNKFKDNKNRMVDKLIMSFEKGKLLVNDEVYEMKVPVPSL